MKKKILFPLVVMLVMVAPLVYSATNAYTQSCTYTALDHNSWIEINVLLMLLVMMVASFIYSLASFLPAGSRERMRGAAKVEVVQIFLSFFIILALIAFAAATCQAGEGLTQGLTSQGTETFQDPMQYSQAYIGDLLFVKSAELFGQMYSESVEFVLWGNLLSELITVFEVPITQEVHLQLNANAVGVYYGYAGVLSGTYAALLVVTYAILFVLWITLPIIEALALTVIVPVALIMRSLPFTGPRLRESADSFFSIAIAFYFILPLTITLDSYIMGWVLCTNSNFGGQFILPAQCNPFIAITGHPLLTTLDVNSFFSGNPSKINSGLFGVGVPFSFFEGAVTGGGGLFSYIENGFKTLFIMPYVINGFGNEIAQYLFQAIFLVALDIVITIGFAQGLTKGLNAMSNIMGFGPFWSSV
jgi:hypothetical protein